MFLFLRHRLWMYVPLAWFLGAHSVLSDTTVWNFPADGLPFSAAEGPATLDFWDPLDTGWGPENTQFGTVSSFGLPPLPGGDADVMFFPATDVNQGFQMTLNAASNGSQANRPGAVANYTLVMDILWPQDSDGRYRSLYQTDLSNTDDGEFFFENAPSGGIGISGNYLGTVAPNEWYRIAVTVRAADGEGQLHRYIDGQFVGGQGTTGSSIGSRWGLDPSFLLFADNSGETAAGFVSSIRFVDRQLMPDEIAALGGPTALGTAIAGAAPEPLPLLARDVPIIIAHRGRSCCTPENTVAAIDAAFDVGATAVEVDIRTSADGVAILMHDNTLVRTTDGSGIASALTVAQLKELDAGSWFDASFAGEPVPTLAEALVAADGRGRLLLDTKESGMGAVINQALIDASALAGTTIDASSIWPWSGGSLAAAEDYAANIPNVEIVHGAPPSTLDADGFAALQELGIVGFDVGSASQVFVDAVHENGMFITEFTVLDPEEMRELVIKGVDGMETDFPGVLSSILPLRGDANGDRRVTIDDYIVIRDNFLDSVESRVLGDLTADGLVDFDDFGQWFVSFPGGEDAARQAIAEIPEPNGLLMAAIAAIAFCLGRRSNSVDDSDRPLRSV